MVSPEQLKALRLAAAVLWRCLVLSFALLLFWFVVILAAGDFAYSVQTRWFDISRHEFDLVSYCGLGLMKLFSIVFFLFPWIALHLVIRKAERGLRS